MPSLRLQNSFLSRRLSQGGLSGLENQFNRGNPTGKRYLSSPLLTRILIRVNSLSVSLEIYWGLVRMLSLFGLCFHIKGSKSLLSFIPFLSTHEEHSSCIHTAKNTFFEIFEPQVCRRKER